MERAANLKMAFFLALLVIGSYLNGKTEAKVQCKRVSDCVKRCGKCTAVNCIKGICECECNNIGDIKQLTPSQCKAVQDCVQVCAIKGCKPLYCKDGTCYCQCKNAALRLEDIKQKQQIQCVIPSDCVGICHGCTVNQCTAGLCVCGC